MNQLAIVFDMDGLMVDTEPISRRAWEEILRPFGHTLSDDVYSQMIGHRSHESAQMVLAAYPMPLSAAELVRRKSAIISQIRAQGVPVMPGLYELLDALRQRGLPWGVGTSSPRHHALEILQQLGLHSECRAVVGGDEVAHGKPAPDIYLEAARRLKTPPASCLALEDSAPGCRAALAAGMLAVTVPNRDTKTAVANIAHHSYTSLLHVAADLEMLLAELARRKAIL